MKRTAIIFRKGKFLLFPANMYLFFFLYVHVDMIGKRRPLKIRIAPLFPIGYQFCDQRFSHICFIWKVNQVSITLHCTIHEPASQNLIFDYCCSKWWQMRISKTNIVSCPYFQIWSRWSQLQTRSQATQSATKFENLLYLSKYCYCAKENFSRDSTTRYVRKSLAVIRQKSLWWMRCVNGSDKETTVELQYSKKFFPVLFAKFTAEPNINGLIFEGRPSYYFIGR